MAKGAYIGVGNFVPRALPNGYTQVEYIQSSGTQYVDTGFVPNQDTRVVGEFEATALRNYRAPFGVRTGLAKSVTTLVGLTQAFYNYGDEYAFADYGNTYERMTIDANKNVATFAGSETVTISLATATFTAEYNLLIGSYNDGGTAAPETSAWVGKIYYCQVYDNGTLVRDYVPCKNSGGVFGLFDLANNVFYQNAGTGTFTAGATYTSVARKVKKGYIGVENFVPRALPSGYTQVEYIESTGTQHIDMGVKPNQTTRVEIEVDVTTNTTSTLGVLGCRATTSGNYFALWEIDGVFKWQYEKQTISSGVTAYGRHTVIVDKSGIMVDGSLSSATEGTISCNYNMLLFAVSTGGTADSRMVSAKFYSCRIYDNGTLIRDYVPCINPSGTAGLYDIKNAKFYANAGTGSFVAGATYKGIARKIKKAYIGIGGVARPCWSGGELAYYGGITPLSSARRYLSATSVGDYALFGGGSPASGYSSVVDAYNTSLSRTTPTALSTARNYLAATAVGDYALFGGGNNASNYRTEVDAYNTSLTKNTSVKSLYNSSQWLAATTVGIYALFGGGYGSNNYEKLNTVNAYDSTLTRTIPTALSVARQKLKATSVGNYALFGGGEASSQSNVVDAYNTSLTRSNPANLDSTLYNHSATTVGDYAIFHGGVGTYCTAYNASLTKTTISGIDPLIYDSAATSIGNYALFGGGYKGTTQYTTVYVYDTLLTRTVMNLPYKKSDLAATTIGDYALFGGGSTSGSGIQATVCAFTVA